MSKPRRAAVNTRPPPTIENRTVSPRQGKTNAAARSREYLTPAEVASLVKAARQNRWGHRDSTMLLVAYHHGLRATELCGLRWEQVDFEAACLHVRRVKKGNPATHPIPGRELRALRREKRESPPSPYVFVSERGSPMTPAAFAKLLARLGEAIGFPLKLHPHMLRHSCGYKLANDGQDTRAIQAYLGHRNIQHTVRYTELAPQRFKGFFED
jgi:integrase